MKSLQEVIDRFPNSKYARDAKLKLDLARDHLAGKEMAVGRYYERQRMYLAAINRFRIVVDNYQTTTHVPEAFSRLIECYEALGLPEEAKNTAAVLGYNYPGNEWYSDSYTLVTGKPPEDPKAPGSGRLVFPRPALVDARHAPWPVDPRCRLIDRLDIAFQPGLPC